MQLSRADFEQGLNDWLKQGKNTANTAAGFKQADPSDWQLKREPFTGQSWLERLDKVVIGHYQADDADEADSLKEQEVVEPEDAAVTSVKTSSGQATSFFVDLYIAYSPVYQVPVLYFRGRLRDGAVLPLDKLVQSSFFYASGSEYPLNTLLEDSSASVTEAKAHFPAISQGEHPQLGMPCVYLHPCETSLALQDILANRHENEVTPLQIIKTWFMLVSTLVDIR